MWTCRDPEAVTVSGRMESRRRLKLSSINALAGRNSHGQEKPGTRPSKVTESKLEVWVSSADEELPVLTDDIRSADSAKV